jgi:hypothetical protein
MIEFLCRQGNRYEHQQPKQRIAADLLKEQLMPTPVQFGETLAITE